MAKHVSFAHPCARGNIVRNEITRGRALQVSRVMVVSSSGASN